MSEKATNDALRRFIEMLKRVGRPKEEALELKSQLCQIKKKAHDVAVSSFDTWFRKARVLEVRVCMLCAELDLLKRLESANCHL